MSSNGQLTCTIPKQLSDWQLSDLWVNGAVSIPDCTEPITTQRPDSFVSLLKIDACCHIGGMVIFCHFFFCTMMYCSLIQAVY